MSKQKSLSKAAADPNVPSVGHKTAVSNNHLLLTQKHELFHGPLPHPDILAAYEKIQPGFADRIVAMAEAEAIHRRASEEKALTADIEFNRKMFSEARLGQIFAFMIGLSAILAGAYAGINGAGVTGSLIGGSGVIGLVAVFVIGRKLPPK